MARRLGQHFLTDPRILDRTVAALDPEPTDVVIEIGAGRGTLTSRLAPRVGGVIAIEKDSKLVAALGGKGKGERGNVLPTNVRLIRADALEGDWHQLVRETAFPLSHFPFPRFKVVGNIPYYITTPLIEKSLTPPLPAVIVFLMQREVADRLIAAPGSKTFGALTAGVQVLARVERLFAVKAGAFHPPPRVDSAVVRLTPLAQPLIAAEDHPPFRGFLAALFGARRKQLIRSLRQITGASKPDVERVLQASDVSPDQRPEMLTPQQLVELFRATRALTSQPGDM